MFVKYYFTNLRVNTLPYNYLIVVWNVPRLGARAKIVLDAVNSEV